MMAHLKVGTWLGLGIGLLLGVVVGLAGASYWGTNDSPRSAPGVLQRDAKFAEHSARAQANTLRLRRFAKGALLTANSPEKATESRRKWEEQHALQAARLDDLDKYATRQADKDVVRAMRKELADYDAGFTRALAKIQEGKITTPEVASKAFSAWTQNRE